MKIIKIFILIFCIFLPTLFSFQVSATVQGNMVPEGAITEYIVIRAEGPVDISVEQSGEILSSSCGLPEAIAEFGRMDIFGNDGRIKTFCVRYWDIYNVSIQGTGSGVLHYTIRFFQNDELVDERTIYDIDVNENTVIHTKTIKTGDTKLSINPDGSGKTIDLEVSENQEISQSEAIESNSDIAANATVDETNRTGTPEVQRIIYVYIAIGIGILILTIVFILIIKRHRTK